MIEQKSKMQDDLLMIHELTLKTICLIFTKNKHIVKIISY